MLTRVFILLIICIAAAFAQEHHHGVGSLPVDTRVFACAPSESSICVLHNGTAFAVDSGSGSQVRHTLSLYVGTTYTFNSTSGFSATHPFVITTSSTGAAGTSFLGVAAGVTGTNPMTANGQTLLFKPLASQLGTSLYYQCKNHESMGAQLIIEAPLPVPGTITVAKTIDNGSSSLAPSSTNNVFLQMSYTKGSVGTATISALRVDKTGTSSAADAKIDSVKLWKDANGDGIINAGDTQLGSGMLSSSSITFSGLSLAATTSPEYLLISADINASATGLDSLGFKLVDSSFVTTSFGTISSTNFPIQNSSTATLPVEMTSFTASESKVSGSVELRWNIATESGNSGFAVERRMLTASIGKPDASDATWKQIGFVQGAGTSNAPHTYSFTDAPGFSGRFAYRLKQIDRSGAFTYTSSAEVEVGTAPRQFVLGQNFPNPFNPSTVIAVTLVRDGRLKLQVYDVSGSLVRTLYDGTALAGYRLQFPFDASGLATGTYVVRAETEAGSASKKMLFLK